MENIESYADKVKAERDAIEDRFVGPRRISQMNRVLSEVNFMPLEPPVGEFNLSRLERVIYGSWKNSGLKR